VARRARALAHRSWAAVLWPGTVRGWWATLARDLPPADLYHACGSLTIAPALRAADRARRGGRPSIVVYDAVDAVFEGNNVLAMPRLLRRWNAHRERGWARRADARTTVNDALADRLADAWGTARPVVVPNYPAVGTSAPAGDRIRAATGIPGHVRIVLFQGRLSPNLGLDEAASAVLQVQDAALVLIGFGRWSDRCRARDADPHFAGRHFTLPAVHPDELLDWTGSADVALIPLPPISTNQRLSTPNKFWEALAAGVPVVVSRHLEVMAAVVREHDLGVVAASSEPGDLARALSSVLDVPGAERRARRDRIMATAQRHYSWATAEAVYRDLVRTTAADELP
jgi:glycosyltransferase involved in cell wall biosynthesis